VKNRFIIFRSCRCLLTIFFYTAFACFAISCRSQPRSKDKSHKPAVKVETQGILTIEADAIPFMAMEATSENSQIYKGIAARLAAEGISLEPAEYYHMLLVFNVRRSDVVKVRQMLKKDSNLRDMLEPFISDEFKKCCPP